MREKTAGFTRPPIPPAYEFLYQEKTEAGLPVRFYCAKGGRGKGATWSIARRLIDKAHTQNSRILCTRSIQNSIADSVLRVLADQITLLGYGDFFDVQANKIRSLISGSEFIFRGLNDLTVQSVKSMEGVTDVWVAEAEDMGDRSWRVLRPTIRAKGSKFWVDYNPDDEKSATNKMFTVNLPRTALVRHINYDENPYFPAELEEERQESLLMIANAPNDDAREQAQMDYNHVWLGQCRKVSKASIFGARYIVEEFTPEANAEWAGPYDGADWGFSQDPTVRVRCWIRTLPTGRKRLCVEREAYGVGIENDDLGRLFDGTLPGHLQEWPNSRTTKIRADNARPETISHVKRMGFNIMPADKWKGSVEDGIEHIRGNYDQIIVHPRCKQTAEEMRLYSYKIDKHTGEPTTDIVDKFNHCMDAIRYALDGVIKGRRGFFSV